MAFPPEPCAQLLAEGLSRLKRREALSWWTTKIQPLLRLSKVIAPDQYELLLLYQMNSMLSQILLEQNYSPRNLSSSGKKNLACCSFSLIKSNKRKVLV